ncbi:Dihydroorotate dehydrogenase (quinone), mitochondrial [Globomyces sp. JEL0801]|nr:Dihydroorotate dehydrogenase (quinone), mitochondrial [Globomyces sp. JEL0801]
MSFNHFRRLRLFSTGPRNPPVAFNARLASSIVGTAVIGTLGYFYVKDSRALIYPWIVMPAMHLLDPEDSHNLSIWFAKYGISPKDTTIDSPNLSVKLWNKTISNPIGLAAGYDKHSEAMDALFDFGFGLVELGSVTPQPQKGNPKPRFFRLPSDNAVINRYGFNSDGHTIVLNRLKNRLRRWLATHTLSKSIEEQKDLPNSLKKGKLLGINLGKNKLSPADSHQDYIDGIQKLGSLADYIVINISSPNTPGLRALQRREPIEQLLSLAKTARDQHLTHNPPLLVKISPDCSEQELEDIAYVVKNVGIDDPSVIRQMGGLSGKPVRDLAIESVRKFYKLTNGEVPIIGCGGISSGEDALAFAKAGASVVQLYTSLGYAGPGLIPEIKESLSNLLQKEGLTWAESIGLDHRNKK